MLPVWAEAPGGNLHLFSVSDHLEQRPRMWRPMDGPYPVMVSDEFRYIDIGAGVPDDIFAAADAAAATS